ncbi:cytochrome P450 [Umezawaea endophytica]|uniref:Cytochrome P450 n=1 Tax=Umezawaea endophytica TaxID=1654476 RepID=A0A9X3A684_9PSEU|nr:cytochrome P450 [Umezawaea endophytica]MCS7483118.1 cytochrome P450 [Umezawaea endophytica]
MTIQDTGVTEFPVRKPDVPFPPPQYADFRDRDGLVRSVLPTGCPVWLVTRHEDVRMVLTDRRISSNPSLPGFPNVAVTGGVPRQDQIPGWFVGLDPPEHDRFRKALIPEFSVRRVREWQPTIQSIVDAQIDAMLAKGDSAELVAELALPVPSLVISTILGVPPIDRDFFESRTKTLVSVQTTTEGERDVAVRELLRYLERLIALKQKRPGDDLVSRLLANGNLEPRELTGVVMLLLIAGHETTANNIALGVVTLLGNPRWIGDSRAVDELLRYHSVADLVALRVAVEDVEVGGQLIKAGEGIMPLIAGANRDDRNFGCPEDFDPGRTTRNHVAFGYGVHQCLGQNLVRAEMEIVYRTLFERVPTLALDTTPDLLRFKHDGTLFGLHTLPVRW